MKSTIWISIVFLVFVVSSCVGGRGQIASQLVGTEWEVTDMSGFPADNRIGGNFDFTSGQFRYHDTINSVSMPIKWTDTGFVVQEGGTSTGVGVSPDAQTQPYLHLLTKTGSKITVTIFDDDTIVLTSGELEVKATTQSDQ